MSLRDVQKTDDFAHREVIHGGKRRKAELRVGLQPLYLQRRLTRPVTSYGRLYDRFFVALASAWCAPLSRARLTRR